MENTKIKIDELKYIHSRLKDRGERESEAIKNNMSNEFWTSIRGKLSSGELVNIAILGEVAGSKSTSGIAIAHEINEILNRKFKRVVFTPGKYIFADQTEFLRFIQQDKRHVCIVIDEYNRMAETGINATTEERLYDHYSDVFAQKFVHKVTISPSTVQDRNATMVLTYIGKDEKAKVSRFKLAYRDVSSGGYPLVLGYVDIDVSRIINEEYYKDYRRKKFKRMELIDKYKVRDIREPELAGIVLGVVRELTDMARLKKVPQEVIIGMMEQVSKKSRGIGIYSEYVKLKIVSDSKAILGIIFEIEKLKDLRAKVVEKSPDKVDIVRKAEETNIALMNSLIKEQERLDNMYTEYMRIGK